MARLTRRRFIQIGLTGASGVALGAGAGWALKSGEAPPLPAEDKAAYRIRALPSVCGACPAACGLVGHVRKGKLLKLEGLPGHPDSRGRICARGVAGTNLLYHPERIKAPQKRVGARGRGQWKEISWDEAESLLTAAWENALGSPAETRAILQTRNLDDDGALGKFCLAVGPERLLCLSGHSLPLSQQLADLQVAGRAGLVPDLAHCRYILNFGANFFEDHPRFVAFNARFAQARVELGARLITVSPFLHQTAGRSDQWVPVAPQTEGLVALALAAIMLQEGLAAREADYLQDHFKGFDLSQAAKASGVPAEDLYRLAREFAATPNAVAIAGRELGEAFGGLEALQSVLLLNRLKGNLEVPGGMITAAAFDSELPVPAAEPFRAPTPRWEEQAAALIPALARGEVKCGFYLLYNSNPAYELPDPAATKQVLADEKLVPFLAVADSLPSETAALADLVLPATTYLEEWGLVERESLERLPYVALRQPLVAAVGKAKSLGEILHGLLSRTHPARAADLNLNAAKAGIQKRCADLASVQAAGGLAALQKKGFYLISETPRRLNPGGLSWAKNFAPPVYRPDPGLQGLGEAEFYFYSYPVGVHTPRTAGLKWLAEIAHRNPLILHPEAAARLKIKDGDQVRVSSPAGEIITGVMLLEGIHPRLAVIGRDFGHWASGKLALAEPFKSQDPETHLVWWENEGPGVPPQKVTPNNPNPVSQGAVWLTKVTIAKV